MLIAMQGNWKVTVKSKNAAFDQRFIISGAMSGNGTHPGIPGTSVNVTGKQWTVAIQNNPGTGFQLSDTILKFPHQVGGNYEFEIWSNDAGPDKDFNDLILTCSTAANINDFIVYGNVSLYSGSCVFNPCRKGPYVIDTRNSLLEAIKNPKIKDLIKKLYPEIIEEIEYPYPPVPPNPPDPFKPIVLDLFNEATQPKTALVYQRKEPELKTNTKARKELAASDIAMNNFNLLKTISSKNSLAAAVDNFDRLEVLKVIDKLHYRLCNVYAAPNITLTFEEYDRSAAELAGGAYTGTGDRRLLGDTITDMQGNYIFRFSFDMTFPYLEDAADVAPGENVNVVPYPDIIVKVIDASPFNVLYESAPYYNISNLKRINLCLPKSQIKPTSACFNGNLIGSLGNIFIGGNQNSTASGADADLQRWGYNNYLEADGKISVDSSLAGFKIQCAAWRGVIDMKGCMYDTAKPADQNTIKWYTIRIKRAGTGNWEFVSQNYKHPRFSKRHLPNYTGDDVGPFTTSLHVDGGGAVNVPAYKNIQREIFVDGIDWEFSNSDRYMRLNTALYDLLAGVRSPGTFLVRVDCYNAAGNPVANGTDMIALYIQNLPLNFQLKVPTITDPAVVNAGCGLYRLTNAQLNTPIGLSFKANDPYGFVHSYELSMGRCPAPMIALKVNSPKPPLSDTASGASILAHGEASGNTPHDCPGYSGTIQDFSETGLVAVEFQPAPAEGGWIKAGEYFTVIGFELRAYQRVTNGYNTGLSDLYYAATHINLELLNP